MIIYTLSLDKRVCSGYFPFFFPLLYIIYNPLFIRNYATKIG